MPTKQSFPDQVLNAGHMVPMDQPKIGELVRKFIKQ